jgi:hypothetical protein
MALKKTHDAVYAGEKYADREGNEKTRYVNVGALFARDDGSLTMKLESLPIGFNGWINFYEPKERDQSQGQRSQRPQRSAPPADDFQDDGSIPF